MVKLASLIKNTKSQSVKDVFLKRTQTGTPNPANDNITHININHSAKSWLGRFFSNGNLAFSIPELGGFNNVNTFRLYVIADTPDDSLRYINSIKADKLFRKNEMKVHISDFYDYVKDAFRQILNTNPNILKQLVATELPFDCYYLRKNPSQTDIAIRPRNAQWIISMVEELRTEFKNKETPVRPDYAKIIARIPVEEAVVVETPVVKEAAPKKKRKPKPKAKRVTKVEVSVEGEEFKMTHTPADQEASPEDVLHYTADEVEVIRSELEAAQREVIAEAVLPTESLEAVKEEADTNPLAHFDFGEIDDIEPIDIGIESKA